MSYGHAISNYGWTSGVSNASSVVNNAATVAGSDIVTWDNGDVAIAWARPIYGSGSTVSHVLALSTYSGGSWSTQDIDTASRTGYKPSMEIDKDGALHIAYIDRDNTRLRYATNATSNGAWSLSTLDESSPNPNNDWVRTGLVLDTKGHVHIIHPVQGSGVWMLNYTTNVSVAAILTEQMPELHANISTMVANITNLIFAPRTSSLHPSALSNFPNYWKRLIRTLFMPEVEYQRG